MDLKRSRPLPDPKAREEYKALDARLKARRAAKMRREDAEETERRIWHRQVADAIMISHDIADLDGLG